MAKKSVNTEIEASRFHDGANFSAYDFLGCHFHFDAKRSTYVYVFRVWAPRADSVKLVGDITTWDTARAPKMEKGAYGVWEISLFRERDFENTNYKYAVKSGRKTVLKSDPFAFYSQTRGESASIIRNIDSLTFTDGEWMKRRHKAYFGNTERKKRHFYPSPLNIYEVHLGSWHTKDDKPVADGRHYLNYREIADRLAEYLVDMGYTHAELMPVMEHPFDGSWGYQVTGYFAPTSRFGTPDDFAYFVDRLHNAGIGVILDWVPAHFPKDENGLIDFDGKPLYEYADRRRMEHKGWGTRCFDVGRREVQSFLISNALFWLGKYHVDGLRVDAVASMLYLDYDRAPGEWTPNENGGNECLEAVEFFKKLNTAVFAEFPDALMIAEESTAWPMVTRPASDGGLGFNFKWNMGFANDMYWYVSRDPIYRQYDHNKLTFPMMYAYSENFILPVSHDEVVHGKKSLLDKMWGKYDDKFSMMRAYLTFLMTMPGKKLLFMGTEFAQYREWDFSNSLEWFMTEYPRHAEMQSFIKTLNHLYLETPALYEIDDGWDGFEWIDPDRCGDNTVIYKRVDTAGKELIVVVNFSPVGRRDYTFPAKSGEYSPILNSDDPEFGGTGFLTDGVVKAVRGVFRFDLPPYAALIFRKTINRKRT